ncbi:MAG: DUF3500 domain-containing protein [Pseudomonadales bacterium]|nr:DUF3500 domain-containing protein [Pseudomonadales bacterium]
MNKLLKWLLIVIAVIGVLVLLAYAYRDRVISFAIDQYGLSEPFVGLSATGEIRTGLFPIRETGVETTPVLEAVRTFLDTLDAQQRAAASFDIDSDEWQRWSNIHIYARQGPGLLDMTEAQKNAAYGLLEASLSERGYLQARDIMRLDTTLGELRGGEFEWYDEERFWFTVMGQPDPVEPWGWQVDGHHLVINYFVLGDQVVMSPTFLGAEPVIAESGKHAGVAVLQEEQDQGLAMMLALSDAQQADALLTADKPGNNNYGEFYSDNAVVPLEGVRVGDFTLEQERQFLSLVGLYVGNLTAGHARVKMTEVVQHLDETYFAWVGSTRDDGAYYYRITSPVIVVEFDHQQPVGLSHLTESSLPQRKHVHVTIRTPNGNDYGKDLLRQHIAASHPPTDAAEVMRARIEAQQKQPDRHRFDQPRDEGRRPFETFQFLTVQEGMTVLDVGAYAGYTTEMLAAAVGPTGKVYSHNTDRVLKKFADGYYERTMNERLADGRLPNVEMHVAEYEDLGLDSEIDVVWLGNLLHDFYYQDGEVKAVAFLKSIGDSLKPNGILGLTDHIGDSSFDNKNLHRIEPRIVRRLLKDAGFRVEAESGLFANPADDHSKMVYEESVYRNTDRFFYRAKKLDG